MKVGDLVRYNKPDLHHCGIGLVIGLKEELGLRWVMAQWIDKYTTKIREPLVELSTHLEVISESR
jgi:hypothetical protein